MKLVMLTQTRWKGQSLRKGDVVAVDDVTAERWQRFGIAKPAREKNSMSTPLPKDFPAADLLNAAGYSTLEQLQSASDDDLTAIRGIGAATAKAIRERL
jgi:predicted flap endonuclease-1-like 5' DNA nuclease